MSGVVEGYLEEEAVLLGRFRAASKKGKQLNKFGDAVVRAGIEHGVPQELLAKLLKVSASAINQRRNNQSEAQ